MTTIAIINSKGGVGKTTLTANLSAWLAEKRRQKVLLIDLDQQGSLSAYYEIEQSAPGGIQQLYQSRSFTDCISKTCIDNLDIVVNDDPYGSLADRVKDDAEGRYILRWSLEELRQQNRYDHVVIDTHGGINALFDVAVYAADIMISPVTPDTMSAREFLRTTAGQVANLSRSAHKLNIPAGSLFGLFYREKRTRVAREHHREINAIAAENDYFGMLDTTIPELTAYEVATANGEPVHRMAGEDGQRACDLLAAVWSEIQNHLKREAA